MKALCGELNPCKQGHEPVNNRANLSALTPVGYCLKIAFNVLILKHLIWRLIFLFYNIMWIEIVHKTRRIFNIESVTHVQIYLEDPAGKWRDRKTMRTTSLKNKKYYIHEIFRQNSYGKNNAFDDFFILKFKKNFRSRFSDNYYYTRGWVEMMHF